MERLLEIMRRLRAPDGCPWDRKQTHESLRPYLLEEAAEAVDAIGGGNPREVADELGDVLLQVAFHAVIAEESGDFGYEDVEGAIVSKLVRRHPHVFGDTRVDDADEVVRNWQAIKAREKGATPESATDSVPRSLPALKRAAEIGKVLGWQPPAVEDGMPEADARAIGTHLLRVAQLARAHGIDPEIALRDAVEAAIGEALRE